MIIKAYKAIIAQGKKDFAEKFFSESKKKIQEEYLVSGKLMNVNVFGCDRDLYIYIESCGDEITPQELFKGAEDFLCTWPDGKDKYFYPITEIFHFNEPQSTEHWMRKKAPATCIGMIAKIKTSLAARYIFYHYQFQEENPGAGDKFGRIFLMGDTAFYYGEEPPYVEAPLHKGALSTKNTPQGEEWQNIMGEHFIWWDDSYKAIDANSYDWETEEYPENCTNNQWLYLKKYLSMQQTM